MSQSVTQSGGSPDGIAKAFIGQWAPSSVHDLHRRAKAIPKTEALDESLCRRRASIPDAVIDELTSLGKGDYAANDRLRKLGTRNLIDAAVAAGIERVVAQSVCPPRQVRTD